jgi:predicted dehydrogenase
MTAPDQVLLSGVLQNGAVVSVHLKGGTTNGTRFLLEMHGTEGALAIVPADPRQETYIQVSEFTVRGAQGRNQLADLSVPEGYRWVPSAVPAGLPFNVAQLYRRMAEGIREGKFVSPDFDLAVNRHKLLDVISEGVGHREPADSLATIVRLFGSGLRRCHHFGEMAVAAGIGR